MTLSTEQTTNPPVQPKNLPAGALLNENKKNGYIQVYRYEYELDPSTGKKIRVRVSLGSLDGDKQFVPSPQYRLRLDLERLQEENRQLKQKLTASQAPCVEVAGRAAAVETSVTNAIATSKLDSRTKSSPIDLPALVTVALFCALTGESDAVSIEQYAKTYCEFFRKTMPSLRVEDFSHDSVRRLLLLIDPAQFDQFYTQMTQKMIRRQDGRIIAADGQAVRATALTDRKDNGKHGAYYLMNLYDTASKVCIAHKIIEQKTNEITVGPKLLKGWDLHDCFVTADAMSCQINFVETVLSQGGGYLISLKGNQSKSFDEIRAIFNSAHPSHIHVLQCQPEMGHGRIENRRYQIISGKFLSKVIRKKWPGLTEGSVVKLTKSVTNKRTGQDSFEESYYISSIASNPENLKLIAKVVRSHWGIENNLHWMLDMHWQQDRMQAINPNYISNRSALCKMALAYIENYRYWLWDHKRIKSEDDVSIRSLQLQCRKPEVALECIAAGLGFI